jgi:hypothetical protein
LKRLKTDIANKAPSSLATPSEFCQIVGQGHTIFCNRPFTYDTIPIELLEPSFGQFKDRCSKQPSDKGVAFLSELAPVACSWYAKDKMRIAEVKNVLEKYTGFQLHAEALPGTNNATNGNTAVIIVPGVIRECKNEDGHAINQAIIRYANYLSQALDNPKSYANYNTRFPCILVIDRGMSEFIVPSAPSAHVICRVDSGILRCALGW